MKAPFIIVSLPITGKAQVINVNNITMMEPSLDNTIIHFVDGTVLKVRGYCNEILNQIKEVMGDSGGDEVGSLYSRRV